ncbi:MAG: ASPIC/UnbV domain-containing protein [Kofleriaceae bacterium]
MSSQSATKNALGAGPRAATKMDLSGHERDKLFLSRAAKDVVDVSYLSGADGIEDARAFAKADLDRDGFEDLIVVNRNAPLLRVYRNALGPATKHHWISLRIEGKQPIGARVTAKGCGITQTRELAAGAGFATENSMAITLGLGTCTTLDELAVKWPGGERRSFKAVAADRFYRVVEGKGIAPVDVPRATASTPPPSTPTPAALAKLVANAPGTKPLVLVDLFATWCEACVRTAPRLDAITANTVDVVSVSVEPNDDRAAVEKFRTDHGFSRALMAFDAAIGREVNELFDGIPALPSTLLIDRKTGAIVLQTRGIPSRSELERAVWERR